MTLLTCQLTSVLLDQTFGRKTRNPALVQVRKLLEWRLDTICHVMYAVCMKLGMQVSKSTLQFPISVQFLPVALLDCYGLILFLHTSFARLGSFRLVLKIDVPFEVQLSVKNKHIMCWLFSTKRIFFSYFCLTACLLQLPEPWRTCLSKILCKCLRVVVKNCSFTSLLFGIEFFTNQSAANHTKIQSDVSVLLNLDQICKAKQAPILFPRWTCV